MRRIDITWMLLLFFPGAILLGYGSYLDQTGWTDENGILANLYAAFTTAFFAVPTAAIVLQRILRRDADSRRQRQILRVAKRTLSDIQQLLDRRDAGEAKALRRIALEALEALSACRYMHDTSENFTEILLDTQVQLNTLALRFGAIYRKLAYEPEVHASILNRWRFFTQTVMLEAETEALQVIPDQGYTEVTQSIDQINAFDFADGFNFRILCDRVIGRLSELNEAGPDSVTASDMTDWERLLEQIRRIEALFAARLVVTNVVGSALRRVDRETSETS